MRMGIYNTATSSWKTTTDYTYEDTIDQNGVEHKSSRLSTISGLGKTGTYSRLANSNRISSVSFNNNYPSATYIYDGAKKIAVLRNCVLAEKYVWQPESSGDADVILFDAGGVYATDANKNVSAYYTMDEWASAIVGILYTYSPFGEPTTSVRRFAFSSEEWLGDYGLLRYLYRDYSPSLKRFLTRDPIGEAGGVNLYNFVGNNPVTK
ncbi:MAG: RHS repeat-associated core domain-containing protein [Victivallaceae bacterium]|nr:RHS repeat-associated core domain-containing protein [Victivallaceae bacterium]